MTTFLVYIAKALYNANGFVPSWIARIAICLCTLLFAFSVQVVPVNILNDNSMTVGICSVSSTEDLRILCTDPSHPISLYCCRGRCLDCCFLDILTTPQAPHHWLHEVRMHDFQSRPRLGNVSDHVAYTRTAHILQRLTVFAVNTGIWTATFAVLTVILVRVVLHQSTVYPDPNTDACLPNKYDLHCARYSALLALLQYSSRQPECKSVHWGWRNAKHYWYGLVQRHQFVRHHQDWKTEQQWRVHIGFSTGVSRNPSWMAGRCLSDDGRDFWRPQRQWSVRIPS